MKSRKTLRTQILSIFIIAEENQMEKVFTN
jgi:hypothetical protein